MKVKITNFAVRHFRSNDYRILQDGGGDDEAGRQRARPLLPFRHRVRPLRVFGQPDGRQRVDLDPDVLRLAGRGRVARLFEHHGRVVVGFEAGAINSFYTEVF